MEHTIHDDSGVTILDLSGEVDVSQAPHLRNILTKLLDQGNGRLLVNMADVAYIDSAGLSVLIAAHRKAQGANGAFGLSSPQATVQKVFNLTRMSKVFQIYPTLEEGVTALKNGS